MKKIKNSFVNRLFRTKKYNENLMDFKTSQALVSMAEEFLYRIGNANRLIELMHLHKEMYAAGYKISSISPNKYGMFRTENIETMRPDEVYLGDVWGLSTQNIPFWEEHDDDTMSCNGWGMDESTLIYDIIATQYRNTLRNAIKTIVQQAKSSIEEYKKLGY